jgi:hypothetical protein
MDSADLLYGRPGAGLAARFQRCVSQVMAAGSWGDFFPLAGLKTPTQGHLTAWWVPCFTELCCAALCGAVRCCAVWCGGGASMMGQILGRGCMRSSESFLHLWATCMHAHGAAAFALNLPWMALALARSGSSKQASADRLCACALPWPQAAPGVAQLAGQGLPPAQHGLCRRAVQGREQDPAQGRALQASGWRKRGRDEGRVVVGGGGGVAAED